MKFSLIFFQNVLLYTIYKSKENYIYSEVGILLSEGQKSQNTQFLSYLCILTMILLYFEFVAMLVGYSVPFRFAKWNLLQIVLHLLGCLFTLWFILDTWNFTRIKFHSLCNYMHVWFCIFC